jgi:hypothetical protein
MSQRWEGVPRWFVLAAALVLFLQAPGHTLAKGKSGDKQCVRQCAETRKSCQRDCKTDCRTQYSDKKKSRDRKSCDQACRSACKLDFVVCKDECRAGPSPATP